jgi:hypothetical protein
MGPLLVNIPRRQAPIRAVIARRKATTILAADYPGTTQGTA